MIYNFIEQMKMVFLLLSKVAYLALLYLTKNTYCSECYATRSLPEHQQMVCASKDFAMFLYKKSLRTARILVRVASRLLRKVARGNKSVCTPAGCFRVPFNHLLRWLSSSQTTRFGFALHLTVVSIICPAIRKKR